MADDQAAAAAAADARAKAAAEAETKRQDEAKKMLKEDNARRADNQARVDKLAEESPPTPTQEENDLAKLGALPEGAKDQAGPDDPVRRAQEAGRKGSYETRSGEPLARTPQK